MKQEWIEILGTKNLNEVNWIETSEKPRLPEDFIREFKDRLDWHYIYGNQILSESFNTASSAFSILLSSSVISTNCIGALLLCIKLYQNHL